jgi:dephospho-CoA kinase
MRVGLTGGLGSGKSTVGQALAARGAAVVDADEVARRVVAPGTPGEQAVLDRFGPGVTGPDGHIDRQALAAVVFAEPAERRALEAITHPLVHDEIARELSLIEAPVVVIELPLLTPGTRGRYQLDVVVLVDTPEDLAVSRAVTRGMAEQDARARIAAQPSDAERRAAADRALVNDGDEAELERAVDELWDWLTAWRQPGPEAPSPGPAPAEPV